MRTVTLTDFGPCQKLHCKNGGSCDNQNGTAVCLCVNLYRGIECELAPCTTALPVVEHAKHTNVTVFSDGSRVNYSCSSDYTLSTTANNGYTCSSRNNSWIGEQPECIPKNCTSPLPDVANATHTILAVFQHGTRVIYTCASGYKFLDPNTNGYTCSAGNDSWIGQQPQCIPKNCSSTLPDIGNATHTSTTIFPHGTRVNYTCLDGYGFSNPEVNGYTCDAENNIWLGQPPLCISKICTKQLPDVENATHANLTAVSDGVKVVYTCLDGYKFITPNANGYTCTSRTNSWIGETPQCVSKDTCDWKDTSKAHKAVKQGMTSCYCMVQTPGESTPRKLQIIKRRPVVTMTQMLTAAGMGAGGMGGGLGVALILYLVVTKVMKKKPGKRPLPTPSPRTTRVGPRK